MFFVVFCISKSLLKFIQAFQQTWWKLPSDTCRSPNPGFRDFCTRILHYITKYILFGYILVFIAFLTFLNSMHRFRVIGMYQIAQEVLSYLLLFLIPSLGLSLSLSPTPLSLPLSFFFLEKGHSFYNFSVWGKRLKYHFPNTFFFWTF